MTQLIRYAHSLLLTALALALGAAAVAQPTFDTDAYRRFLTEHAELDADGILTLHNAGYFRARMNGSFSAARYADSIDKYYHITASERELIGRHGFMVTERLREKNFGDAFLDIYNRDLPVYVSSDAILHALHRSYDDMLVEIEEMMLIPALDTLLGRMAGAIPDLQAKYGTSAMRPALRDLDLYITTTRSLLKPGSAYAPFYIENVGPRDTLMHLIAAEQPADYALFAKAPRTIDFSQFTPRGHYTQKPSLTNYFKAMIWLGRTEMQLIAPVEPGAPQRPWRDMQRQAILSLLVNEAIASSRADYLHERIDRAIAVLVGESDNITVANLRSFVAENGPADPRALLDSARFQAFSAQLATKSYAGQRINSQILMSDPLSPEQIEPAAAFLLFGQRYIVDSYVTGELVYDKIIYDGQKVPRMLPATLDILAALGNDAALQLLRPELQKYHYAPNLAALRYLIDAYEPGFWDETVYNGWLNAIRSLNPPGRREALPAFMQTAAWWQKTMNTQLASWAQLRHDNLLYAKQSYSGGAGCSYPKSLVEPVPEFYAAVRRFAANAGEKIERMEGMNDYSRERLVRYFRGMAATMDTLESVARKELVDGPLADAEVRFLQTMLYEGRDGCTTVMTGWYPALYFNGEDALRKEDLVVADVHTAPTNEAGDVVGWVLHGGTGALNMAVVTCGMPNGESVAFIGPVMSYYEHVSTNFKRLTDEEWKTEYLRDPSFRPAFTDLYLADTTGTAKGGTVMLVSGMPVEPRAAAPRGMEMRAYPTPFASATVIALIMPVYPEGDRARVDVYDVNGRRVRTLHDGALGTGAFTMRWDGTDDAGHRLAPGTYYCTAHVGRESSTVAVTLLGR